MPVLSDCGKNLYPELSLNLPSVSTMPLRPLGNSVTKTFFAFTGLRSSD